MNEDCYYFTSEYVSCGHPDKIADQISDAILDELLTHDPYARVAAETMVSDNLVILMGEITASCREPNYVDIARQTIRQIGYDKAEYGFNADTCAVFVHYNKQSPDIAVGVNSAIDKIGSLGAGDQGIMFGYASCETDEFMPLSIYYARRLINQQNALRKQGFSWIRPDAKSQVTVKYNLSGKPISIDTIVLSTQHDPDIDINHLREIIIEKIIKTTIPHHLIDHNTKYLINPTGRFVIGGPVGDCGLTGRKIIVDTYGGVASHGGGAFSGKDPSKVDRSAAYFARYLAKNIVASGIASRCQIQMAYAIGVSEPVSLHVNTFSTNTEYDLKIASLIKQNFDLTPSGMIKYLNLLRPIYLQTAKYGHFGKLDHDYETFTWEKTDVKSLFSGSI